MQKQMLKQFKKLQKEEAETFKKRMFWINKDNQLQSRLIELKRQMELNGIEY